MKNRNYSLVNIARSMVGGAGLALAECRASAKGAKLNMSLINESTKATFFIVLAAPLAIICFIAGISFISVQSINDKAAAVNQSIAHQESTVTASHNSAFQGNCTSYGTEKTATDCPKTVAK